MKVKRLVFVLYAPNARNVWLILTTYGIQQYRSEMNKNHKGLWDIVTDKAPSGPTYLYLINDYHMEDICYEQIQ
ncbi:unnamed protein product [Rotaria sp. Silwood2]|nr:unnamed protein product [Rotaria sp. Silwood2]CAF2823516.1 unnamed protein product [Rotaria sp. Silwood2]CAF3142086.1 unnamed protein product [Rotaria sp. Silwood2]CAF3998084.1 unnamed protein product [Rotaria sp. Silwood2]CAF4189771.1 unnamed protein product [Rotaria sp. Silwood2]